MLSKVSNKMFGLRTDFNQSWFISDYRVLCVRKKIQAIINNGDKFDESLIRYIATHESDERVKEVAYKYLEVLELSLSVFHNDLDKMNFISVGKLKMVNGNKRYNFRYKMSQCHLIYKSDGIEIEYFETDPAYLKRGHARILLDTIISKAKEEAIPMSLIVLPKNKNININRLMSFYKELGFVDCPTIRNRMILS